VAFRWQEFIDNLFCSGSKQKYERCSANYAQCQKRLIDLDAELAKADDMIKKLKLLVPRPAPPELTNIVEKDTVWVSSILAKINAPVIRLPLGAEFHLVDKDTFIDFIAWDWVDSFEYHKFYRCGNFAISLKASSDQWGVNQVGIVLDYKSGHAYNLVIFPNGKVMLLEPQTDNLFFHEEHAPQFYPLEGAVVII